MRTSALCLVFCLSWPGSAGSAQALAGELAAPIRVKATKSASAAQFAAALAAYRAGDLAGAELILREVLAKEPRHLPALLGLATLALRQERLDVAEAYLRRAIETDPKDVWAQAGLLNLKALSQPLLAESRLKSLSHAAPDAFLPHFALGNLYAALARWRDAQGAYQRAIGSDPGNPDAIFNLAVVFDHLRDSDRAATYYRQALAAAEKRPTATSKALIVARLDQIAGAAP